MTIEEVKEKLNEMRVSQIEFARRLNLKQQAVGQWFSRGEIPLKHQKSVNAFFNIKDEIQIIVAGKTYSFAEAKDAMFFLQGIDALS